MKLAAGDKVVISPGLHTETLKPSGEGTAEKLIVIEFLPGVHEFAAGDAIPIAVVRLQFLRCSDAAQADRH